MLELVAAGTTNREAAARLFISEATVKTHLLHIYAKLGVSDRAAAVAEAFNRGLLTPESPRQPARQLHMSSTRSALGRAQQMSTSPSAGGSSGSGATDGPGQRGGAGVADAGPAAPPGGDVAGVGQLEHAALAVGEGPGCAPRAKVTTARL